MSFWLFKSEPEKWSWSDQLRKGSVGESWDGIRNFQASNNMRSMKIGDLGFFYHSSKEKKIIGIVKVIKEYYPDYTDETGRFGMVDIVAIKATVNQVSLKDIKQKEDLKDICLIKQGRLSVLSISDNEWEIILKMSETNI
jgi:predicted RNA-binding protein with PUA-like domain